MDKRRVRRIGTLGIIGLCSLGLFAKCMGPSQPVISASKVGQAGTTADTEWTQFSKTVQPFFVNNCVTCHGDEMPEKGIRLNDFSDEATVEKKAHVLTHALEMIRSHKMPPSDQKQPSAKELKPVMAWLDRFTTKVELVDMKNPGHVTLHRLNRAEYNNTVHDLLGVEFKPADGFPEDDAGYGFDNNGDVLTLAPLLMDKYLTAAEMVLDRAIMVQPIVAPPVKHWDAATLEGTLPKGTPAPPGAGNANAGQNNPIGRPFPYNGEIYAEYDFPKSGTYTFRLKGYGTQGTAPQAGSAQGARGGRGPQGARPQVQFKIDGQPVDKPVSVTADFRGQLIFTTATGAKVSAGHHVVTLAFINGPTKEELDATVAAQAIAAADPGAANPAAGNGAVAAANPAGGNPAFGNGRRGGFNRGNGNAAANVAAAPAAAGDAAVAPVVPAAPDAAVAVAPPVGNPAFGNGRRGGFNRGNGNVAANAAAAPVAAGDAAVAPVVPAAPDAAVAAVTPPPVGNPAFGNGRRGGFNRGNGNAAAPQAGNAANNGVAAGAVAVAGGTPMPVAPTPVVMPPGAGGAAAAAGVPPVVGRGGAGRGRGAQAPAASPTGKPTLGVVFMETEGPLENSIDRMPESYQKVFVSLPSDTVSKEQAAREVITHFATKAYRRPVKDSEVDRLMAYWTEIDKSGETFESSIAAALQPVLASPYFLYRVEEEPTANDPDGVRTLNEYELASRLSYFLWSSMPDDELMNLAREGKLRENLEGQIKRMMASPKSFALCENFAGQWLQLRKMAIVLPDSKKFPDGVFDEELRSAMLKETQLFFSAIITEDRSVLDFIDADFTFMNERLAKHYGRTDVKGEEFRRVTLSENERGGGGLVTQASILTLTSFPTRTSPVLRGKWVLENLLDQAPPPPPPNVPQLKDDAKEANVALTLRQQMEAHRSNVNCITCHSAMDPIGFGLENFDAIGAWRDLDLNGQAIDASGKLPDGQSFTGPAGLKKILLAQKDQFCECLVNRMMTYALGRGMEQADRPRITKIAAAMKEHDYKFSSMITQIVESDSFQKQGMKKGEDP